MTEDVIFPSLISKLLSSLLYGSICRSLKHHRISLDSVCLRSVSVDLWQGRYLDAGLIEQALQRPSSFSLISLRLWVSVETKSQFYSSETIFYWFYYHFYNRDLSGRHKNWKQMFCRCNEVFSEYHIFGFSSSTTDYSMLSNKDEIWKLYTLH